VHEILFIADVHLSANSPRIVELFLHFLAVRATYADRLYILGDLFETWLGDDDADPITLRVKEALLATSRQNTQIFIQHGNRDFLLGEDFCAQSGATLLDEETIITLYGVDALVLHGDQLCTHDQAYQAFRAQVRNPEWQRMFLAKPIEQRRFIANGVRAESRNYTQKMNDSLLMVDQVTVEDLVNQHGVPVVIHGHTHQPAVHEFVLSGFPVRRYVVGDWRAEGAEILAWTPTGGQLETFR